jgi:hypothetical protein
MKNAAKKQRKVKPASTEVVSARLPKPELSNLRKLYPGSSNQDIIERLVEEKLARKDFDIWINRLREASESGHLDLDLV